MVAMDQFFMAVAGVALVAEGLFPAFMPETWRATVHRLLEFDEEGRKLIGWISLFFALGAFWLGYFLLSGEDKGNVAPWSAVAVGVGVAALFEGTLIRASASSETLRGLMSKLRETPTPQIRGIGALAEIGGLSLAVLALS